MDRLVIASGHQPHGATISQDAASSREGRPRRHGPDRSRSRAAISLGAALTVTLSLLASSGRAAEPVTTWYVPVLMYHRVAPDSDLRASIPDLVVRPRLFAAHMRALHAASWNTITASALAEAMRARIAIPPGTVVLSFDDGTQDAYTNAWPIMRRHGFVGSFYVITSRIYRKNRPSSYSMSQIQVQDLAASGNEIGNHTRDHTCLSGTAFDVEAYEIGRGARDIRGVAGAQPATLAWPKGCYDSSAVRAAREAGTFLAFTTYPGCHETFANRLTAPRIRVHRTTTAAGLLRMLAPCRPAPHGLDTSTSSSQLRGPEAR